jgi:hypothetical protein
MWTWCEDYKFDAIHYQQNCNSYESHSVMTFSNTSFVKLINHTLCVVLNAILITTRELYNITLDRKTKLAFFANIC